MYSNILPYSEQRDRTVLQGHHDNANRGRARRLHRLRQQSLKHVVHDSARRVRSAFSRSDSKPSMSWWS